MGNQDFDTIFEIAVQKHFPELLETFGKLGWLWVKSQAITESGLDPSAVSPVGAAGVMQIMPATARYLGIEHEVFDAEANINAGVRYLAEQWAHLQELPHNTDRLFASFASYNGGRGYVNEALKLGRVLCSQPKDFNVWCTKGRRRGLWQCWVVIARLLERVELRGIRPDHSQMTDYVSRISVVFSSLASGYL